MRGTPTARHAKTRPAGIIPAYAGNTRSFGVLSCLARDHPRVCGEHKVDGGRVVGIAGSSPRMRGTPGRRPVMGLAPGIIPAYAGNTA